MDNPILSTAEARRARRELGLTQREVASEGGLSRSKLSWLEGGRMIPDDDFIQELRDFYESKGVEFDDRDGAGDDDEDDKGKKADKADKGGDRDRERTRHKYRGGLRISDELDQADVEAVMDEMERNDERIAELLEEEAGEGVSVKGGLLNTQQLHLTGEDRLVAEELIQRMAAQYVLVRMLQGKAVVLPPEGDEVIRRPWRAADHGELLAAQVAPYVGRRPVEGEDGANDEEADLDDEDEGEREKKVSRRRRRVREAMRAVQ